MEESEAQDGKDLRIKLLIAGAVIGAIIGPYIPFVRSVIFGSAVGMVLAVVLGTKYVLRDDERMREELLK